MKILIIEDDQLLANIYRNKFALENFQVEVALDGETGVKAVRSFRPDAVIVDLMLPKLSGVEVIKQVRAEPDFQNLPLIVFSNTYLSNLVQEAWKAGATKCLSKSNCSPTQLIQVIKGALANGHKAPHLPAPSQASQADTTAASNSDGDAAFQADLRTSLIEILPETLSSLRALLQGIIKEKQEIPRLKQVHEMYRRVHALTGNAGIAGMLQLAQLSDALEALLKELYEKPKNINGSSVRTLASAVDLLPVLFEQYSFGDPELPPANILVVDDEAISRRALTYALEKAKLKSVSVDDPHVALKLLEENAFDLVFLDVDMPGMTGFELCGKLRAIPAHQHTPVVFVTVLNDLGNRANSMVSGGNDFIGKPFLFMELAVKALVFVLRRRVEMTKAGVECITASGRA